MTLNWDGDSSTRFVAVTLNDSPPIGESIRKKIVLENLVHDGKKAGIK